MSKKVYIISARMSIDWHKEKLIDRGFAVINEPLERKLAVLDADCVYLLSDWPSSMKSVDNAILAAESGLPFLSRRLI